MAPSLSLCLWPSREHMLRSCLGAALSCVQGVNLSPKNGGGTSTRRWLRRSCRRQAPDRGGSGAVAFVFISSARACVSRGVAETTAPPEYGPSGREQGGNTGNKVWMPFHLVQPLLDTMSIRCARTCMDPYQCASRALVRWKPGKLNNFYNSDMVFRVGQNTYFYMVSDGNDGFGLVFIDIYFVS